MPAAAPTHRLNVLTRIKLRSGGWRAHLSCYYDFICCAIAPGHISDATTAASAARAARCHADHTLPLRLAAFCPLLQFIHSIAPSPA